MPTGLVLSSWLLINPLSWRWFLVYWPILALEMVPKRDENPAQYGWLLTLSLFSFFGILIQQNWWTLFYGAVSTEQTKTPELWNLGPVMWAHLTLFIWFSLKEFKAKDQSTKGASAAF